jgi:succinylarginine dihydrolase
VLFAHEKAFADRDTLVAELAAKVPGFELVEVAEADVPLSDAVKSYLFNAQLVTPPDGAMTLVAPTECRDTPSVAGWIERHLASNGAIRRVNFVDVRQSMANGGGPACLRLRVACDPAEVDPRFLVGEDKLDRLAKVIGDHWPEQISSDDIQSPALIADVERARQALLQALELAELQ